MKILKKIIAPPWLALILGVPAMACMAALRRMAMDEQLMFEPGHPAGLLLWALTAVMAVLLAVSLRRLGGKAKYARMFPASAPAAAGILAAGLGLLWTNLRDLASGGELIELVVWVLGLVSGVCLVYLAWCRWRGIRASFLLWSCVTAYLMLRLMLSYQTWSSQPELLHYFFPLLGSVCVTLAFYYRTAFCVGMGSRRMYLAFAQMGMFCCLVTLAAGFDAFYAGMLLWSGLDLCSLRPMKSGAHEKLPEEQP